MLSLSRCKQSRTKRDQEVSTDRAFKKCTRKYALVVKFILLKSLNTKETVTNCTEHLSIPWHSWQRSNCVFPGRSHRQKCNSHISRTAQHTRWPCHSVSRWGIFNPKNYVADFGNFKQGFLSMKLIKRRVISGFRVCFFNSCIDINWY